MKYLVLFFSIAVVSCKSTQPINCSESKLSICDIYQYHTDTREALERFERFKGEKSFALAQSKNGSEIVGYSHGLKTKKGADRRALKGCKDRVKAMNINMTCYLIR